MNPAFSTEFTTFGTANSTAANSTDGSNETSPSHETRRDSAGRNVRPNSHDDTIVRINQNFIQDTADPSLQPSLQDNNRFFTNQENISLPVQNASPVAFNPGNSCRVWLTDNGNRVSQPTDESRALREPSENYHDYLWLRDIGTTTSTTIHDNSFESAMFAQRPSSEYPETLNFAPEAVNPATEQWDVTNHRGADPFSASNLFCDANLNGLERQFQQACAMTEPVLDEWENEEICQRSNAAAVQMEYSRSPPASHNFSSRDIPSHLPSSDNSLPDLLTDNSLSDIERLERRVEEATALIDRVAREWQEKKDFEQALKNKEQEIRRQRAREKQRQEASELASINRRGGFPAEQRAITANLSVPCEHYQRKCRVMFPCCNVYYACHRCHNESNKCPNTELKARDATLVKCSECNFTQEIGENSQYCQNCKLKFSEYFCSTCKHFARDDHNPYHCDKCGICRKHKDNSFHCEICNVCLDKRLEGKHKCRPNSGHDECCICLEDSFSGCQILPCSHKVHRDCAIAMQKNGVRSCPVCRHPLYETNSNQK